MERRKILGPKEIDMFRSVPDEDIILLSARIVNEQLLAKYQDFLSEYLESIISSLYVEYPEAPENSNKNYNNNLIIEETSYQTMVRLENIRFWFILIDNALKLIRISKNKQLQFPNYESKFDFIPRKRSLMRFKAYLMSENRRKIIRKEEIES